jgi:hypothetical protein
MGAGHSIACIDCKKDYYLGYGSYTCWEELLQPRFPKTEHQRHQTIHYTEDYTHLDCKTGQLMTMSDPGTYDVVLIDDFASFESINLSGTG